MKAPSHRVFAFCTLAVLLAAWPLWRTVAAPPTGSSRTGGARVATPLPAGNTKSKGKASASGVATPLPVVTPVPIGTPQPAAAPPAPVISFKASGATKQRPLLVLRNAKAHFVFGRWCESSTPDGIAARLSTRAYRASAERGFADAQVALGMALQFGIGAPANLDDAERWFAAAAAQGHGAGSASLADVQATALRLDAQSAASMSQASRAWQAMSQPEREHARKVARATFQATLESLLRSRDRDQARQGFLQALQQDPSYVEPRLNLAKIAEAEEAWDAAIRWLQEAIRLEPTTARAVEARLNIDRLVKTKAQAQTETGQRSIRYERELASAGSCLDAREYGDAVAHAEEAQRIDPDRYESFSLLAAAHSALHENTKAQERIRQAQGKAPAEMRAALQKAAQEIDLDIAAEGLLAQASTALAAEQFGPAGQAYEQAWQARPDREGYGLRAALAYQLGGFQDRARAVLKKLVISKDLAISQAAANQMAKLNNGANP